jgi:hypothetical protein
MPKYVSLHHKAADLSTPFGLEWATKLFGEEAIASLPVKLAGKHKGSPKGFICWRKAAESGYCRECMSPVRAGQLVDAWIGAGYFSARSDALSGMWLGRMQSLAASAPAGFFFDEGRAREATRQAADAARWEEEKADMQEARA